MINVSSCHPAADWAACGDTPDVTPQMKAAAEDTAWEVFQQLTGGRLSLCPIQLRPCADDCLQFPRFPIFVEGMYSMGSPFVPLLNGGVWTNLVCGCQGDCSCTTVSTVTLPPGSWVDSVMIDGEELTRGAWRVDWGSKLVRLDGKAWPKCQDMTLGPDAEGAFTVTAYTGQIATNADKIAVAVLAQEYLIACGGGECRLPSNVTQVTRNGVTQVFDNGAYPGGFTGLPIVDARIMVYNPNNLKRRPRVRSVDVKRTRVPTEY